MSAILLFLLLAVGMQAEDARPNILFCIADDASYAHFPRDPHSRVALHPQFRA